MKRQGYQQGDVLMEMVTAVPSGAKLVPPSPRGYVLAQGEHTGHAHVISTAPEIEMYDRNGTLYLKAASECAVIHEEHKPQTLPPGIYKIGRVVEVDPFADEVRVVAD